MAEVIPTHTHSVVDADRPFIINPITKEITAGSTNLTLAQHSKNSDRLTFSIPDTIIEGHDMSKCNSVKIHFQNVCQKSGQVSTGIYSVTDLAVADGRVTLSWLIGAEATLYAGGLSFSIHFGCTAEDGTVVYNFPTLTYSKITVGATIWNSDTIAREYPDIIAEVDARIAALEALGLFAYNFTTVCEAPKVLEDETVEYDYYNNPQDAEAIERIVHHWQEDPMSIYIQGYPVIGVDINNHHLKVLWNDRYIYTFNWWVDGRLENVSLWPHSVATLAYNDEVKSSVERLLGSIKKYIDEQDVAIKKEIGDIDTALDEILAIQNSLIGGGSA